jgi:hypothetical protein
MRVPYYCPYCDQRSTRRWNLDVHIKRKHGGYSLGRSSDRYIGSNPISLNDPYHNIGSATVADSVGETFQSRYIPQQAPMGTPPSTNRPLLHTKDDHRYGTGLSPGAIQKIQELKALMNKYPRYHTNPDGIIRLAIYNSINGDYTLLDDKLEQLRTLDSKILNFDISSKG